MFLKAFNNTPRLCLFQARSFSLTSLASYNNTFKYEDLQINLCKNPAKKPEDPNKILFGQAFTDNMLSIEWAAEEGWHKPQIHELRNLSIHPAAKVLHYAVEIFEGMKAYRGVDAKVRLFRPEFNMARFHKSSIRSVLPDFDKEELLKCIKKLVAVEKDWVPNSKSASLYVRPIMIGTEPTLGVSSSNKALLYVLTGPAGPYFPTGFKPIALLADPQYTRSFYGGVGDCKVGSNYGPTIFVGKHANKHGCQQVLWLFGEEEYITEAGTMNFFVVFKNQKDEVEMVTAPLDGLILEGVTRRSALDLGKHWKDVKVSERRMTMKELIDLADNNRILEAFGTGTACVVAPIDRIAYKGKDYLLPTMKNGSPYLTRISKQLNDIQYGVVKSEWTQLVE